MPHASLGYASASPPGRPSGDQADDRAVEAAGAASPAGEAEAQAGGWTTGRLVGMAVLVAAAVVAMFDAWGDIWTFATRNEENTHILLTPLVAGWLFYIRRDALLSHRPRFSYVGRRSSRRRGACRPTDITTPCRCSGTSVPSSRSSGRR
ncbi:MAG: hypothetical protein ACOC3G_00720 [Phycisphaeraceae bacterium]